MAVATAQLDTLCRGLMDPSNHALPPQFPKISGTTRTLFTKLCPTKTLPDLEGSLRNLRKETRSSIKLKHKHDVETNKLFATALVGAASVTAAVDYLFVETLGICGWKWALPITAPLVWTAACYLVIGNRRFSISFEPVNQVETAIKQFKEFFSEENFQVLNKEIQAKIITSRTTSAGRNVHQKALAELQRAYQACH